MGDILDLLKCFINGEPSCSAEHLAKMAVARIEHQQERIEELEEQLIIQTKRGDLASPTMHTAFDFKELHDKVCKERDELAATVERLRETGTKLRDDIDLSKIVGAGKRNFANEWDDVISATPAANLNHVKREVYADGFYQGFSDAWCSNFDWEQDHVHYGLEQSEIRAEQEYPSVKDGE